MKKIAKAALGALALASVGALASTPANAQTFGFSFGTGPGYYGPSIYAYGGDPYYRPYRPYYYGYRYRPAYSYYYGRPYYRSYYGRPYYRRY